MAVGPEMSRPELKAAFLLSDAALPPHLCADAISAGNVDSVCADCYLCALDLSGVLKAELFVTSLRCSWLTAQRTGRQISFILTEALGNHRN